MPSSIFDWRRVNPWPPAIRPDLGHLQGRSSLRTLRPLRSEVTTEDMGFSLALDSRAASSIGKGRLMRRLIVCCLLAAMSTLALLGTATVGRSAAPLAVELCKQGKYVDLFAQDGTGTAANPSTTFVKQAECMNWVRSGGEVGTLKPELIPDSGVMHFWLTVSGAASVGTVRVCGDLPLLVSYTVSGAGPVGSGCLDPPAYGTPFQILYGPCTVGGTTTVDVLLAKSDGGVVKRTVSAVCG